MSQLEVSGHPIKYEASKIEVQLKGTGLEFEFAKDKKGNPLLVLTDAEDGNVDLKVAKADIKGDISNRNLEKLGFTKYQKTSTGKYEKVLGDGPNLINRDS